ncbi:MAG TPA: OmpA family protein [Bdellovibrionales bacterium]|nr:OmpA family protein [Bdellovibrionales bacterium]
MANNLLSMVQGGLSQDFIGKASSSLGQSQQQTRSGLMAVIPVVLGGLIHKGSTPDGASSLLNTIRSGGYDSDRPLSSIDQGDFTKRGADLNNGIFGSNLSSVTSKLGSSMGLSSSIVSKLMAFAAPLALGSLGSVVKKQGLNASGLSSYLGQQRSSLTGLVPHGVLPDAYDRPEQLHRDERVVRDDRVVHDERIARDRHVERRDEKKSWLPMALAALVAVVVGLWLIRGFNARREVARAPAEAVRTQPVAQVPSEQPVTQQPQQVQETNQISQYLDSGATGDVPRNFRLENVRFVSGTAELVPESNDEIKEIADAMKAHPNAKASIEGYTDATGSPNTNVELSNDRAITVRDQLVDLGVEADRLQTAGRGANNPVASNDTPEGREQNRRIEFVIISK